MSVELAHQIDACLPQTQCTQCGFPRCVDYAEAIALGKADINQCPPGGEVTIEALAALLDRPIKTLNPEHGTHAPRVRAVIDESQCIGCTLCLDVCPVDAIVGANKRMHTVIAQHCTGCELCLPPCPVDCIALIPTPPATPLSCWPEYGVAEVSAARQRNSRHVRRLQRQAAETALTRLHRSLRGTSGKQQIQEKIQQAVARVRGKSNASPKSDKP